MLQRCNRLRGRAASAGRRRTRISDRRRPDGASPPTDSLRGRTILVADADADTRELYRLCLQSTGAKVCDAFDGRDALAKTYSERPDAIVIDVQLPFIDGLELCRLLRIDAMTSRLPLVLVAAEPVDGGRAGQLARRR